MALEWSRVLATLLLVAIAFAAWKLILQPTQQPLKKKRSGSSTPASSATAHGRALGAKTTKKKTKKRAVKKHVAASSSKDTTNIPPLAPPVAASAAPASATAPAVSASDSDSDDGLSAAQILARRKFTTKRALGGGGIRSQPTPPQFAVHERVVARFQGGTEWFPATINEVRRGNEYNVTYDDGEREFRVPQALIQPRSSSSSDVVDSVATANAVDNAAEPHRDSSSSSSDDARRVVGSTTNDNDDDDSDESDGWSIVGASSNAKQPRGGGAAISASSLPPPLIDGLTKRQRESRRKKERQREVKELARAQAQEHGLHAKWGGTRNKMTYVPPPPPTPSAL